MEEASSQDLLIVACAVFVGLVGIVSFLYLWTKPSGKAGAKTPGSKTPGIGDAAEGTVFVKEEDGRVVRRSTRQVKPPTPLGPRLAAAAAADDSDALQDTETPKRSRTPKASTSKAAPAKSPAVTPRSTRGPGRPRKSELA